MSRWPEEVAKFILENYKGIETGELTEMINARFNTDYTRSQVRVYKKNKRLSSGVNTRFKKGQESWTKGKKLEDFIAADKIKNCQKTQYKPGHQPINRQPLGAERLRRSGRVFVKVGEKKWALRSRVIWEREKGKLDRNTLLIHKNGDTTDDRIENLLAINYNQLCAINRLKLRSRKLQPEINEAGVYIGILKSKIFDRERKRTRCRK